jgi:formate hydrogenlyase subunit 3/multisubunit Na+/H+ antiporter MnhD subunit
MIHNFLPEISLLLCLLAILMIRGFFKKNIDPSLALTIPALICLADYIDIMGDDFHQYAYSEHLTKLITCFIYYVICSEHHSDIMKQLVALLMTLGTMVAFSCSDFITFALSWILLLSIPGYLLMVKEMAFITSASGDESSDRTTKIYIYGVAISSVLLLLATILIYTFGNSVAFGDIGHLLSFSSERGVLSYISLILMLLSSVISICCLLICATITENHNTALTLFLMKIVHSMLFFRIFSCVFHYLEVDDAFLFIACLILVGNIICFCIEKTMLRIMAFVAAYNFGISLMLFINIEATATKGCIILFLSEFLCLRGFFVFLDRIKKRNTATKTIPPVSDPNHGYIKIIPNSGAAVLERCSPFTVSVPIFFLSLVILQPVLGTFAKLYTCISLLNEEHTLSVILFLVTDCARIICLAKMLQQAWQQSDNCELRN